MGVEASLDIDCLLDHFASGRSSVDTALPRLELTAMVWIAAATSVFLNFTESSVPISVPAMVRAAVGRRTCRSSTNQRLGIPVSTGVSRISSTNTERVPSYREYPWKRVRCVRVGLGFGHLQSGGRRHARFGSVKNRTTYVSRSNEYQNSVVDSNTSEFRDTSILMLAPALFGSLDERACLENVVSLLPGGPKISY